MTGMTIGEALKETRKNLELSQTEMAYPILTKSYYSKIERGIHEINASDLIKILEMHDVDISEFLTKCGVKENRIDKEYWGEQLSQAYYDQDLNKVKKLELEIPNIKTDTYTKDLLKSMIILNKANLKESMDTLPNEIKRHVKSLIFKAENWNKENLSLFSISLPLWSDQEMKPIVTSLLKKYINIENFPREMQILVSSIMVNYLSLLIRSSSQNLDLVEDIFILLDNLPVKSLNCFGKIMKNFYRAYFQGDEKKIQDILDFFTNNNINKISEILKVSI